MAEDWRREALWRLNRTSLEMDQIYMRLARGFGGISETGFWILYELRTAGGMPTQGELCRWFGCSKQTLNSALKQLEKHGTVELEGGRGKRIRLTEAGQALAAQVIDPVVEMELSALGHLRRDECEHFLSLLEQHMEATRAGAARLLQQKASGSHEHPTL